MNLWRGREITSLGMKRLALRMVCICGLMTLLPGCSFVVLQADYEEDKAQSKKEVESIRGQLLAHTQILANHGKSLNEFKLQLRNAVSNVEKTVKELKAKPKTKMVSPLPKRKNESSVKFGRHSETYAGTRYIRRIYRGMPLSFAGGYEDPRGSRYPYRLEPGTRVAVISGDRRGFTRVEVRSGRWIGKKMWVRTRWLIERAPKRAKGNKG
ncbi:MAG: hypothetical protein OXL41_00265 [Nitrospinae bacterium]|nr:hypothetical protein [Nitrospinota bacterium]